MRARLSLVGVGLIAALVGAWLFSSPSRGDQPPTPAATPTPVRLVRLPSGASELLLTPAARTALHLQTRPVRHAAARAQVTAYGRLEADPARAALVQAGESGVLVSSRSWPVVGQKIEAGQLLGTIRPILKPSDRLALATQSLDLSTRLASARAQQAAARAALAADQAALAGARAAGRVEAVEVKRLRLLNKSDKNVSDKQLQQAELKLELDHQSARRASRQVHDRGAELAALGGLVAELRGAPSPDSATVSLPLRAPASGRVVSVAVHPGQTVSPGEPLLRVERYDVLLARLTLPPGSVLAPAPGRALVAPLGHPHRLLEGRLVSVAGAESASGAQTLLYQVDATRTGLAPGSAVSARLARPGPRLVGALVPSAALVWGANGTSVYVRLKRGVYQRRPVTLQRSEPDGWLVAGLGPGSQVVVRGAQGLLSAEYQATFLPPPGTGGGEEDDD